MNTLLASSTAPVIGGTVAVLLLLVGIALFAFEIWMIVDAITNPNLDSTSKALWVIGMVLLHPIVGIVYFFTARKRPPTIPEA